MTLWIECSRCGYTQTRPVFNGWERELFKCTCCDFPTPKNPVVMKITGPQAVVKVQEVTC